MKNLLSLDLGVTTGYAVYKLHPSGPALIDYGDIPDTEFEATLKKLALKYMVSYSVAERPVIYRGPLGDKLSVVVRTTEVVLDHQVDLVDPAPWKQTPFKSSPCPRGSSPHAKDAIRLGLWYHASLQNRLQGN